MVNIEFTNIDELTIEEDERRGTLVSMLIPIFIMIVFITIGYANDDNGPINGKWMTIVAVIACSSILFKMFTANQYFQIVINRKAETVRVKRVQMFIFTHKESHSLRQLRLSKRAEKGSYDDYWYYATLHLGSQSYDFHHSLDDEEMENDFEKVKSFLDKNKTSRSS